MSLIIRGPIFTDGKFIEGGVRVEKGVIVDVGSGELGAADTVLDLGPRQTLLPAAIDTLVALRDWGEAPRDTVETVTKAALASGVTVVCDQANTVPRIDNVELARKRADYVAGQSYVDFGVSAHPPRNPADLEKYREAGVSGLNLFSWDLRPWNTPRDTDDSTDMFKRFAEAGFSAMIFPEEQALRETILIDEAENFAIEALLRRLPPEFKVRMLVTLPNNVDRIREARKRLPNVYSLVAPHGVFMSREVGVARIGSAVAVTPPLRSADAVAQMRSYAEAGAIDLFVSHHVPHRTADKFSSDPIPGEFTPKVGFTAMDFAYPLYLTKLGIAAACRGYCEAPATFLGLKKGRIAKGYEADLAVVEENPGTGAPNMHVSGGLTPNIWKVEPDNFYSKARITPFVGERLNYRVIKTYLRGEEAYDAATGQFTRRKVRRL